VFVQFVKGGELLDGGAVAVEQLEELEVVDAEWGS
jgi:hypothetical protein